MFKLKIVKIFTHLFLLFVIIIPLSAQQKNIDSLKHELRISKNDTLKLFHFMLLAGAYEESNYDSSLYYAKNELMLARKLKLRLNEVIALNRMAYALKNMGNFPASLHTYLSGKEIAEDANLKENILPDQYFQLEGFIKKPITARMIHLQTLGLNHFGLCLLYESVNNYEKGLFYGLQAKQYFEKAGNVHNLCLMNMVLGRLYLLLNKKDSALILQEKAYELSVKYNYKANRAGILLNLGRIHLALENRALAAENFRMGVAASWELNYLRGVVAGNLLLSDFYKQEGKKDSIIHFAQTALGIAQHLNSPDLLLRAYRALAAFYRSSNNNDSTVKYQGLIIKINDSILNSKQTQQFQNIEFDEQQRRQEIETTRKTYRHRMQVYGLLFGLSIFLLVAVILWRANKQRQKAYALLEKQKAETDWQRAKAEQALEDLKATQVQLVQREKMASLGELTAGIAHEIQNPLNFVNNFSEVSAELVVELKQEINANNKKAVLDLAVDLEQNLEKIHHHGQRADAIVMGMLQHARSSSGEKQLTNLNALTEEYLRLAYHGFRGKDKTFTCTLETNFDPNLEPVTVVPQEIGRVLLNLYNNAFYAVQQKANLVPAGASGENEIYKPTITVSTHQLPGKVEIRVRDNGTGMPENFKKKVFQPFFTTKPTGQGTGLGLSLSYDIITKGHGGEMTVESKEGEYSQFIICLPVNNNI